MRQQLSAVHISSQEDELDPEALRASIDAITHALVPPTPAELQAENSAAAMRISDYLGCLFEANPPMPSIEDEFEALVASLDLGSLEPTPPPRKSDLFRIVAEIAAMRARVANDDQPAEDPAQAPPRGPARNPKKAAPRPRTSKARDRRNLSILPGFSRDVRSEIRRRAAGASVCGPSPSSKSL